MLSRYFFAPRSASSDLHLRGRWFWLESGTVLLSTLLLVGIWVFTLSRLEQERQLVIDHASVSQRNLAQIVSENLRRLLDGGVQYAQIVGRSPRSSGRGAPPDLSTLLNGDRAYNRAAIFDLDGKSIYASSPLHLSPELKANLLSLSARLDAGTAPALVVASPAQAPEEAWQVPLLLPVRSTANSYSGVLVLHLDLGYLLRLYQDIDIGRSGVIQILKRDGLELARARAGGLEIGHAGNASNPMGAGSQQETRIIPLFNEGRPHLVSIDVVADYPVAVGISQEIGEVLADFQSRRHKFLVSLSLLTIIVLAMTVAVTGVLRRQRHFVDAIVRSEQDKQALIDQLEHEKQHAYELASKDHLTGLANRRMFMTLGASHLARAQRSRKHYALVFLDLDRFKVINDSLGHHVGDLLLHGVSRRLQQHLRQSDVIARLGGDEFAVLITGVEQEDDVVAVTKKLIESISEPFSDLDGHAVQVSPSIGVALYPRDGHDLDALIRHADLAMYQSKRAGRGRCTFFDPAMNVNSASDFDLEQRLPRAIETGELVLHFQPKLDLRSHQASGFEALIRWQHPEHGLIYPNDFIPLAESTGHIIELGNWVITAACLQLAAWRDEGLTPLPVAINLSGRQLTDKALADRIVANLLEHGLDPALLQVEVTESSLIECIEDAGGVLDKLVTAGIKVALDDFGNGFSSLGYIKTLPIDAIKIDRGFVREILNSHDDSVIVLSTISLAHNLGMRVIAEGVETRAQLVHLKTGGCDEVQGYYLSRPIPATEARNWIMNPMKEFS